MNKRKTNTTRTAARDVDDYLARVPEEARATLGTLRKRIKAAAPKATEVISYQMPTFKHHGSLVAFAAFKNHCSFFTMSRSVMEAPKEELKAYDTSPGTIRFPTNKPLSASLVKKLVKARIEQNEARLTSRHKGNRS